MHHMNDKELDLRILQIIRVNGNIKHLLDSGCTHTDIINILNRFMKQGIISVNNIGMSITVKGNQYFNCLCNSLGKKGISRYLSPDIQQRTLPISRDTIYIPTRASEEFSLCENRGR